MQPPSQQHVTPQYHDSVHTGNVVGQQIMQQNIHHHATQFQPVVQPCMGCGSRNYLKPIPCSTSYCKIMCCNQCIKYQGWFKTAVCETHFKLLNILGNIVLGGTVLMGGFAIFALLTYYFI